MLNNLNDCLIDLTETELSELQIYSKDCNTAKMTFETYGSQNSNHECRRLLNIIVSTIKKPRHLCILSILIKSCVSSHDI